MTMAKDLMPRLSLGGLSDLRMRRDHLRGLYERVDQENGHLSAQGWCAARRAVVFYQRYLTVGSAVRHVSVEDARVRMPSRLGA
ncbi:hypothetical protein [Nonomuraea sp. SBT364]|uniref:hypothetical protein n=1 Tax=Nonomuraea sp. SBT364 TaxID=1580530 RepID=UPI0018CE20D5|nr:hypothetical protein [Nonomuraea sp. SBT364]